MKHHIEKLILISGRVTAQIDYLTADVEDNYVVAQANAISCMKMVHSLMKESLDVSKGITLYSNVNKLTIWMFHLSKLFLRQQHVFHSLRMMTRTVRLWERTCNVKQFLFLILKHRSLEQVWNTYLHVIQVQRFLRTYDGIVEHVEAKEIRVRRIETVDGKEVKGDLTIYRLENFIRSNQGTCYNQRPIVSVGDRVKPN